MGERRTQPIYCLNVIELEESTQQRSLTGCILFQFGWKLLFYLAIEHVVRGCARYGVTE